MNLTDPHGRQINYLRLSVTDRCNLRCTYCMPVEGVEKSGHDDILSYEDLLRIASAAVKLGIRKIRITGGEPLIRKGIIEFLQKLSAIPGLERLVLTTNGILLSEMATPLLNAGIESLNISLDSLRPETFATITRGGDLNKVLQGIRAAEKTGFRFIKINMVVMRGINDDEVVDFAAMTLDHPYQIRFIEYMPTLVEQGWESMIVPGEEILEKISRRHTLVAETSEKMAGPARYHRIEGGSGAIGIITPVSCNFCSNCNRIRVTSKGVAKSCLFDHGRMDLRPFLTLRDDAALIEAIRQVVSEKPDRSQVIESASAQRRIAMSRIGG